MNTPNSLAANVAASCAAAASAAQGEHRARAVWELAGDESSGLDEAARAAFWDMLFTLALSRASQQRVKALMVSLDIHQLAKEAESKPLPVKHREPQAGEYDKSTQEAIDDAEWIIENADSVPSAGEDFAQSVASKAAAILARIEESGEATDNQAAALCNMRDGLANWLRED